MPKLVVGILASAVLFACGAKLQGGANEGYTREEVAECLLLLDRQTEATPHFARAWELLHDDPWLSRDESKRLERLKQLGGLN